MPTHARVTAFHATGFCKYPIVGRPKVNVARVTLVGNARNSMYSTCIWIVETKSPYTRGITYLTCAVIRKAESIWVFSYFPLSNARDKTGYSIPCSNIYILCGDTMTKIIIRQKPALYLYKLTTDFLN